jgi:hypothetical protein
VIAARTLVSVCPWLRPARQPQCYRCRESGHHYNTRYRHNSITEAWVYARQVDSRGQRTYRHSTPFLGFDTSLELTKWKGAVYSDLKYIMMMFAYFGYYKLNLGGQRGSMWPRGHTSCWGMCTIKTRVMASIPTKSDSCTSTS